MDNLKSPAFPFINQEGNSLEDRAVFYGFTKLERASLIIASGMLGGYWQDGLPAAMLKTIKEDSVALAKAVIEEANK